MFIPFGSKRITVYTGIDYKLNRQLFIQRNGFIVQYEAEENFRKYVRSLVSLSFIPPDRVQNYFDILRERAPLETHQIFDYFKK